MRKRKLKAKLRDAALAEAAWQATYEKNTATIRELQEQLEAAERRADRRLKVLVAIAFPGTEDGKVNGRTPAAIAHEAVNDLRDAPFTKEGQA